MRCCSDKCLFDCGARCGFCSRILAEKSFSSYRIEPTHSSGNGPTVHEVKAMRLAALKFFALLFLLPGLAGLIVSAVISTHYLATMPKWPVMEQHRFVPRGIHGTTIYQTPEE